MLQAYETIHNEKPKKYSSPIEKNDHPELDESDFLDIDGQKQYQSMVGALQWVVSLGRFDIATAVMTMSRFRAEPRIGHMTRLKRIYGNHREYSTCVFRLRSRKPDYSDLPEQNYDWLSTTYGSVVEIVPKGLPTALGNEIVLTTLVDANFYHDLVP